MIENVLEKELYVWAIVVQISVLRVNEIDFLVIKLIFKIKKKIVIFVDFGVVNVIVVIIEGIFKEKILRDFVQEIDFKVNNDIAVVSDFDLV